MLTTLAQVPNGRPRLMESNEGLQANNKIRKGFIQTEESNIIITKNPNLSQESHNRTFKNTKLP